MYTFMKKEYNNVYIYEKGVQNVYIYEKGVQQCIHL